jgi:hypothetical protein
MSHVLLIGVHLAHCSEHNQMCSKLGALIVLRALSGENKLIDPTTEPDDEHLIENNNN